MSEPSNSTLQTLLHYAQMSALTELQKRFGESVKTAASRGQLGLGVFHLNLRSMAEISARERAESYLAICSRYLESLPHAERPAAVPAVERELRVVLAEDRERVTKELASIARRHAPGLKFGDEFDDAGQTAIDATIAQYQLLTRLHMTSDLQAAALRDGLEQGSDPSKVFVVHGRDSVLRDSMFAFLRALNLAPIEWSEAVELTGESAPYIGQVLDAGFRVAKAVVVLFTPDDEVRLHPDLLRSHDGEDEREICLQPRPNVLFEAGMAFGMHPKRTIMVIVGEVKMLSDVLGRHYVRLTDHIESRTLLAERLRSAGCAVATEGAEWKTVGSFAAPARNVALRPAQKIVQAPDESVTLDFPSRSGIQAGLEADGYQVQWSLSHKVGTMTRLDGWEFVTITNDDGSRSRLTCEQFNEKHYLMKRKRQPAK